MEPFRYVSEAPSNLTILQKEAREVFGEYDLDKSLVWMTEEFGEVIKAVHKGRPTEEIAEEIGDLLSWIICIANHFGIDVSHALRLTMNKEINRQYQEYGSLKYATKQFQVTHVVEESQ